MSKVPEALMYDGHIFLETKTLIEKLKETKKILVKAYEKKHEEMMQQWLDEGRDVDIRSERKMKKQTSANIAHALDRTIQLIERAIPDPS